MIPQKGSNWLDTPELTKPKPEHVPKIEEIVLDDSSSEDSNSKEKDLFVKRSKRNYLTRPRKTYSKDSKGKSLLKPCPPLRGLLPSNRGDESQHKAMQSPVIKRCCIEHCYFLKARSGMFRYNFRNLPADSASSTLQFENKRAVEQPTVDIECLAPGAPANDSSNKNNVNGQRKRSRSRSTSSSSSSRGSSADDSNDRDYCPEGNSSDSETENIRRRASCRRTRGADCRRRIGNASGEDDKTDDVALGASSHSGRFSRYYNSSRRLADMQKLLKTKYVNDKGKTGRMSPPRLKKMMNQKKDNSILKMTEYLFPVSNLGNMTNGEKNWRMEYMDNEVQSLGLDDLLLKASELNAENFTKALGRKLEPVKSNFNAKDGSEIVFTIPKSKKGVEEGCENESDLSKRANVKTIKLDISKPFFEADKGKEGEPPPKPLEEASPKRPGIKVKTVENINEEFQDSLGRLNALEKDPSSSVEKSGFGIANEPDREANSQDESEKDAEGGRPFIMTIIQGKAEKQRPAILRNSYLKKKGSFDKAMQQKMECRLEDEPPADSSKELEKLMEDVDHSGGNTQAAEMGASFPRDPCTESCIDLETDSGKSQDGECRFKIKQRNIPFILNHNRKARRAEMALNKSQSKLVKPTDPPEKPSTADKIFKITSIEQKLYPKETNRRFIKVVPYEPITRHPGKSPECQQKLSDDEPDSLQQDGKASHLLSLSAFATILKEILPDKWFLCLDKKYGLQIIKTHMDEFLNPLILISVVITRCGKVTVNVRGKQLQKSHELFSNLCDMTNSENKLSLNYVMGILNKLRHRSVCWGCDDPALKKYWSEEGVIESQTEFQQVYRSQLCQLLVSLGRRRCYPCYCMNEAIKKRFRRDKLKEKAKAEKEEESKEPTEETPPLAETPKSHQPPSRGMKRNLEDFLEESFSTMKQQIVDELEKNKKQGERESALKAQEEVLSFMGLTRKESLDNPVRKSKRKKNSFYKLQQPVSKKIDQKELEFLEKYWPDINTLFSTSLLFGAYSRTGRGRLREKCRMFQQLLSTWKNIVTTNPEWIGEISLSDDLIVGDNPLGDLATDQFEKMDVPALRAYIISSVKEVNRIKHKLRTRNSYFKVLYNKFVKRRMKRPKSLGSGSQKGNGSSATSTTNTPTPTDFSSDENSRDKEKAVESGPEETMEVEETMGAEETMEAEEAPGAEEMPGMKETMGADMSGVKEMPEGVKETPEGAEETQGVKEMPEGAEKTPEEVKEIPEGVKETPEVADRGEGDGEGGKGEVVQTESVV